MSHYLLFGFRVLCVLTLNLILVISSKEFSLARYKDTAVYANNITIDIRLVGVGEGFEGDQVTDGGALECHTDNDTCCRKRDHPLNQTASGEWYFPNGTVVPPPGNSTIYRTRDHMVVRLNRVASRVMNSVSDSLNGKYICVIPGSDGVNITRNITLINYETVRCSSLPDILNGLITYTPPQTVSAGLPDGQRYVGTIATYRCSAGYQLVGGSSLRACGLNESWNGTEPFCEEFGSGSMMPEQSTDKLLMPMSTDSSGASVTPTIKATSLTTNAPTVIQTISSTSSPFPTPQTESERPMITETQQDISSIIVGTTLSVLLTLITIVIITVICLVLVRYKRASKNREDYIPKQIKLSTLKNSQNDISSSLELSTETILPPAILGFPTHLSPIEGEEVRIEMKLEGYPLPRIVWYQNGEAIVTDYSKEIDEQGSLFFPSIELKHSGVYKVIATNRGGEVEKEVSVSVKSEGCDGGVGGEAEVTSRPVPVAEFGEFVSEHHANGNKKFKESYEMLSKGETDHKITISVTEENKTRNRFKNINVYDDNQLILQPLSDGEETYDNEYFNASYIDGYSHLKKFIAAQGPLSNTVIDFWRMVWQERPSAIVMLTNCEEGGRVKCEQYWPESGSKSYGPFQVIMTDKQILADYTTRKFAIINKPLQDGESFKVTQFHFTSWPDHGVPAYASPVLSFHRLIRSHHVPSSGPLVVHCSAGVGRTGTYITLDNVLDEIKAESLVDIDGTIVKARNQRMKMVQTTEQYIFIHDAILEFLTCGDTQISSTNFKAAMNKLSEEDPTHQCIGYQHQFNVLDQVSPNPTEGNCSIALKHPDKNRGDKYLPVETSRIVLRREQPDYVHAVTANGYKQKKAYIIAQNPLISTVRNFWKVITDRKCGAVVMLSTLEEGGEESCAQYWPSEGTLQFGEFLVKLVDREGTSGLVRRKLLVESNKLLQAHHVTQFHVTNWSSDGTCSNLKVLTDVIEEVTKVRRRTGNYPVLVHCSDTVSRSGMFCTIATTIDRCKTEGVVDVFQVVKALRIHKPGAVLKVEQYKLIHETVLVYLESFDTYANFI